MGVPAKNQSERIRELNDAFRTTLIGGRVVLSAGVRILSECLRRRVMRTLQSSRALRSFGKPNPEHESGTFTVQDIEFYWTIDYYDSTPEFAVRDPSDQVSTKRVLTLMLSSEH